MTAARPAATASRRPLDRAVAALPLVLAYLLLCCLYAWQATQRDSPTIFTDELELGQISRAIADTGEAARRGVPYGFQTLYSFLVAPAWWIDDTASAYEAAKFIGVLVMTATIFPAYALARTIVSKPWALGAAVASAAIPALAYAPVPRRGAARLPRRDHRAVADRAGAGAADGLDDRARGSRLPPARRSSGRSSRS